MPIRLDRNGETHIQLFVELVEKGEVGASRFECSATASVLLCNLVEVRVGDADLFNDFGFIVENKNLRLPFVEVNAKVVISGC